MSDNLLTKVPDIEQLITEHGDCVLYDIYADLEALSIIGKKCALLPDKTCFRITSPSARFITEKNNRLLAFFGDGTLYHSEFADERMLDRFAQIAAAKGFPVKQKIAVEIGCSFMLCKEAGKAMARKYPPADNLVVLATAKKEQFIREIFADGNICLTAAANENIDAEYRDCLALFSDGRFIVSKNYAPNNGINDHRVVNRFMSQYPQYVYLMVEYVPDDYIKAIYCRAGADFVPQKAPEQPVPSAEETERMYGFYNEKLKDIACLSVTTPDDRGTLLPEEYRYAFFKNGILIVDKTLSEGKRQVLKEELHKLFPDLAIHTYRVPSFWIDKIYKAVLKVQKSAKQIYMEMLKQKARKLKKMLDIPHHEALELAAKISGWNNWKQVTTIDESRARYVITIEKQNKNIAAELNLNQVEYEYQEYVKKH